MNTLIISTFSCTFETFEKDVSGFITDMGKEVVSEYEFVKVNDHKSHLLMNVLDMDALCTEMTSDKAKEWDKANNCKDTVYGIELVEKVNALMPSENQQVLRLQLVYFLRRYLFLAVIHPKV